MSKAVESVYPSYVMELRPDDRLDVVDAVRECGPVISAAKRYAMSCERRWTKGWRERRLTIHQDFARVAGTGELVPTALAIDLEVEVSGATYSLRKSSGEWVFVNLAIVT